MIKARADKKQMEKLFELLIIKDENQTLKGPNLRRLNEAIKRTKSGMSKENIIWVEQLVSEE